MTSISRFLAAVVVYRFEKHTVRNNVLFAALWFSFVPFLSSNRLNIPQGYEGSSVWLAIWKSFISQESKQAHSPSYFESSPNMFGVVDLLKKINYSISCLMRFKSFFKNCSSHVFFNDVQWKKVPFSKKANTDHDAPTSILSLWTWCSWNHMHKPSSSKNY